MLRLYSFALDHEVLGTALILHELTGQAIENAALYKGKERVDKIRQVVPMLFDQYSALRGFLMKAGGKI
jgi:hypothetical protein